MTRHRPHTEHMALTAQAMVGGVVWQSVALALGAAGAIMAALTLAALDLLPLWVAGPITGVCVYAIYTPLHEAVHQNIHGTAKGWAWLNPAVGHLAAFFLMHSYEMHKTIHLTHHRETNNPDLDPDHWVAAGNPFMVCLRSMGIFVGYFVYCRRHWRNPALRRAYWIGLRDTGLTLAAVVALGAVAGWEVAVFGYLVPALFAAMVLALLFDYVVHTPHQARSRFENTRVFEFAGGLDTLVTWAYLQQNYHGIHHAFPRIPFTRYRTFFRATRSDVEAAGLPVARYFFK